MILLLSFVLPFLLFISFPSRLWNFDGVACAAALELGNPLFLFHSNHLLYAFLGSLFWKIITPWGLTRALPALQFFTSVLSAGAMTGLYLMLLQLLKDSWTALLVVLCMSITAVVWVWSVEAQVYALGFLALAWAAYLLIQSENPKKWIAVGALHALAVLGHIVHVLWIVPVLYWLSKENRQEKSRDVRHYLTTLFLGVVIPYAVVIGFVVIPREPHAQWLHKWLLGSAALNANSTFQWHGAGWKGVFLWAFTTLHIFWGSFWPYPAGPVSFGAWTLTILSMAGFIGLFAFSWKKRQDTLWVFSVLWLAIYGIFFSTWEPTTECYRMTDTIPLALLIALGLQGVKSVRRRRLWVGGLVSVTLALNFITRIFPMHEARNNVVYQQVKNLERLTPDASLYLTTGGLPWIYLLYFTGRTAWNINSFMSRPEHLAQEIDRHYATHPVYIDRSITTSAGAPNWLTHYKLKPVGGELPWVQLQ